MSSHLCFDSLFSSDFFTSIIVPGLINGEKLIRNQIKEWINDYSLCFVHYKTKAPYSTVGCPILHNYYLTKPGVKPGLHNTFFRMPSNVALSFRPNETVGVLCLECAYQMKTHPDGTSNIINITCEPNWTINVKTGSLIMGTWNRARIKTMICLTIPLGWMHAENG